MLKTLTFIAVLILACGLATSSGAAQVTVNYTGNVTSILATVAGDGVAMDDSVTGQFVYDTTTPNTGDTIYGFYSVQSFSLTIGSFRVNSSGAGLRIQNLSSDQMFVSSGTVTGDTLNGISVTGFQFGFYQVLNSLWNDVSPLDVTDWAAISMADINSGPYNWMKFDGFSPAQMYWNITSISAVASPVPVPATILLLGFGLLGLAGVSRRKK